ncbi:MAG: prepilin-type N-terminal cleavage/methylation domain-containing protein [Sphingomonadales bacterium]
MAEGRHKRHLDCSGFTLIELLIVLAMLGLIAAMLAGSLQFGVRAWSRNEIKAEASEEIKTAQRFLRRRIEDARPFYAGPFTAVGRGPFEGIRDRMVFSSNLPTQIDTGGLFRFLIHTERQAGGVALMVSWVRDRNGKNDPGLTLEGPAEKLLAGIREVRFSYFGKASGEPASRWMEDWVGRNGLPELVRIDVVFKQDDPRLWPELIIRPAVNMDANCVFDPVSKNCRGR